MKKLLFIQSGHSGKKGQYVKFTPLAEPESEGRPVSANPRYLPVEDTGELYVFGALQTNNSLFNFLGQNGIAVHFYDYYENYTGSFMPRDGLLSGKKKQPGYLTLSDCCQRQENVDPFRICSFISLILIESCLFVL